MAEAPGAPDAVDLDEAGDRSADPSDGIELEKKESVEVLAESDGLETSKNFDEAKAEGLASLAETEEQVGEKASKGCDLVDGNVQDVMEEGILEAADDAKEVRDGEEIVEERVSCLENESTMINTIGCGSVDGQLEAAKDSSLEISGGMLSQATVTGPETLIIARSLVNNDLHMDLDVSVLQDSSVGIKNVEQVDEKVGDDHKGDGNQETDVVEERSGGNVGDVMGEGSINAPVDGVQDGTRVEVMDAIGHDTVKGHTQATPYMPLGIGKDMLPQDASIGADPDLAARSADTQLFDENCTSGGDIELTDADPVNLVTELETQGKENSDAGALDEKHMVRANAVLGDFNSMVETNTWKASEMSEIQTLQSQGKESVDTLNGMEVPSVGASFCGDIGENPNKLESSLGKSQIIVTEFEAIKNRVSTPNASFEKVEPNQESEAKQEIRDPSDMWNVMMDDGADVMEEGSIKAPVGAEGVQDLARVAVMDAIRHGTGDGQLQTTTGIVTEFEAIKDCVSTPNASFEKVEPNLESEAKQETRDPSDVGNVIMDECADGMEEGSIKALIDAGGLQDVTSVAVMDAIRHGTGDGHLQTTSMSLEIGEDMLLQDSSMGADPDSATRSADTQLFDENAVSRGNIAKADADPVVEIESQGTENDDTGTLGEKHMVRGDTVLGDSNSVVESSTRKSSEMSEIQTVQSRGKDSFDTLNGINRDMSVQSVGTSVCWDLGENPNKLQSSLGESQNTVTEFESIKNNMSPPNACFEKVEPNQESEAKRQIRDPTDMGNVLMDECADGMEEGSIKALINAGGLQDVTGVAMMDAIGHDSVDGHLQATTGTLLEINEDVLPQDYSMGTDSNIQEAGCREDAEDPNIQDANLVVELESQGTENGDTGALGDKHMLRTDTVLGNSNPVVETRTRKALETTEIQTVQSLGKESVDIFNGMDENIEVQSIGTSVHGNLGANANKLKSFLGVSENIVNKLESLQNDMSPPNECSEKVESTQESEARQESWVPSDTGNVLMDEGTHGKPKMQAGEGEPSEGTEKQAGSAETHLFDENAMNRGDLAKVDASPVIDLESQGIHRIGVNPNDKGEILKFVFSSAVGMENGDTGAIGETRMDRGDTVLGDSNLVVETATLKASEMSEIQIVQSQGKESVDTLNGVDQNLAVQSVGTSVHEDLDANANKLESSLRKSQSIITEFESLRNDMSLSNACFEKVESTQVLEAKEEMQAPNDLGNVIMDEGADGKKVRVGEGDVSEGTEKQVVECVAPNIEVSVLENTLHHSTYCLPHLDNANFSISDLVWGKVKSHPWWPGQIFDPSDASQLALKYQKKDNFLVAYYGDKTFAWCDESQLKPFHSYFSQMVKQCSLETFVSAVNDILMEISRRVELGMTCSCLPEEAYANIEFQKVDNAGVRRGNVNSILDQHLILNYFQPVGLVEYIKTLAQFPNGGVDKLELVIAKSQLKAFYRSKGYPELPILTVDGRLIEDVAENLPSNVEGSGEGNAKHSTPASSDLISGKAKLESKENSFKKGKHVLEDDRKQKSMSELTDEENALHPNGGKCEEKAYEKLISSRMKHTVIGSDSTDSGRHKKRTLDFFEDIEPTSPSPTVTNSFKIGEFIRRAASQLTGAQPIVKCQGESFQKNMPHVDHRRGDVTDFDVLPHATEENEGEKTSFSENNSSTDEMLSQLCLAARDPMTGHSFVSTMVTFFTSVRNSCVSTTSDSTKPVEKRKRGRPRKVIPQPLFTELFSDISSSEDKHVEKHRRGRPRRVDSQPAISDISSSEEKQLVGKCSSQEQHVEKRKRGRPKKVNSMPAISDISSSEEKQVEKRKRGRPKKIISQLASSDMSTPDHMKDSYWSDINLQKRPRKKFLSDDRKRKGEIHKQVQRKRRSAGEQILLLPSGSILDNEQLQLVAMNTNTKTSYVVQRQIISVDEKIVDECMPTALMLSFVSSDVLPSATDLIRIFSRYGPLKEAETDVIKKTYCAKVVFKRRADAETAFSSAGKFSIFGPGLLSYQLKYLPLTPMPAQEIAHQNDAASVVIPQENHDTPSIVTLQDDHNSGIVTPQGSLIPTTLTALPHNHDEEPMTALHDEHDTTTISRPENDSGPIPRPQEYEAAGAIQGCNLAISELAESGIASDTLLVEGRVEELPPQEIYDAASSAILQEKHDATIITPGDYHYLESFTTSQDHPPITTAQDKYSATHTEASTLPEDKYDVTRTANPWDYDDAVTIAASQDYQDATPTTTVQEKYDATQGGISQGNLNPITQDYHDTPSIVTPRDNHSPGIVTPQGNLDPITQDYHGTPSIVTPQDNHNPGIVTPQDNLDLATLTGVPHEHDQEHDTATVSRSEDDSALIPTPEVEKEAGAVQELTESEIASDTILIEGRGEELLPQERYDAAPNGTPKDKLDATIITPGDYDDVLSFTTLQDHQDVAPIMTTQDEYGAKHIHGNNLPEDKNDASLIANPWDYHEAVTITASEDYQDATPTSTVQEKYDANQEQSETPIVVDTMQAEAEGTESSQWDVEVSGV